MSVLRACASTYHLSMQLPQICIVAVAEVEVGHVE